MTLQELKLKVIEFRDERNWKQFHTLKNLLIALNIECAELQELFLWEGDTIDTSKIDHSKREKINEEMGDIIIYLLYLSDYFGIDLLEAASKKIEINRKKYPIDKSFNTSKKYSDFD
ncbi:MAG: nucleotide pyrophosphohydrolase [Ignavibacteria bacterium]|nr:nucleotide pyrophosphohydrolase [Ignavibacteria bacterium]MBT8381168.1 nucleotide pyrophosphohydrolase [Ignavibacteria bacterium]MBT8390421.1 nucleotide pyrophosphohydrolase [Ignavibacteria bacterium]NNJ52318.1 nucleotide pyrophosphohydrolase [Ignavibacteriaceae bacterium]NNL21666.1 nucleotide pyrophosphohydrolase [Ignavibacteriaceae bacterium]